MAVVDPKKKLQIMAYTKKNQVPRLIVNLAVHIFFFYWLRPAWEALQQSPIYIIYNLHMHKIETHFSIEIDDFPHSVSFLRKIAP